MKNLITGLIAIAMLAFSPLPAAKQERDEPEHRYDELQHRHEELDLREREIDLERQELELQFQRQLKQMELAKRKSGLKKFSGKRPCPPPRKMCECAPSRCRQCHCEEMCCIFLVFCLVVHILLAIWVYGDIGERKRGSGLWIVLALITGVLGTLLYVLVRIGDSGGVNRQKK